MRTVYDDDGHNDDNDFVKKQHENHIGGDNGYDNYYNGGIVCIDVSDNGEGNDEDDVGHDVYDKYYENEGDDDIEDTVFTDDVNKH